MALELKRSALAIRPHREHRLDETRAADRLVSTASRYNTADAAAGAATHVQVGDPPRLRARGADE